MSKGKAKNTHNAPDGWSVFQRKDGRWCGEKLVVTDIDGKPVRKYVYAQTKEELMAQLYAPSTAEHAETVEGLLLDWLEYTVKPTLAAKSYTTYSGIVHTHLIPELGNVPVSALTTEIIRKVIFERVDRSKFETARLMRVAMQSALELPVEVGTLTTNPARRIRVPKGEKSEATTLTSEQIKVFFNAVDGDEYQAAWYVLLTLAPRIGEVLGLRWRDWDRPSMSTVSIEEQRQGQNQVRLKSRASKRELTVPATTAQVVKEHWGNELAKGRGKPEDYLFYSRNGKPVSYDTMRARLKKLMVDNGLPTMTPHDLRHTCATLLAENHVPMKTIQGLLGHSKYQTTADLYTKATPKMLREAAETMDRLLF